MPIDFYHGFLLLISGNRSIDNCKSGESVQMYTRFEAKAVTRLPVSQCAYFLGFWSPAMVNWSFISGNVGYSLYYTGFQNFLASVSGNNPKRRAPLILTISKRREIDTWRPAALQYFEIGEAWHLSDEFNMSSLFSHVLYLGL